MSNNQLNAKKILVFTTLFPNNVRPNHGVFVKERMSVVAKLSDCSVKVVAPVPYYPSTTIGWRSAFAKVAHEEVIEGVQVYHPRYWMIPKIGMVLHGLLMFLSLLPVIKIIQRTFDFDLIDAHYIYPDGFAAVLIGAVMKRPVVVSARGSDINEFTRFSLIRKFLHFTLNRAARVIAVCQALKDEMIRVGIPESKIVVIPNGVDPDKFYPSPKKAARKSLGLPIDTKIILSVGELIPRKGFDLLLRSLKIVIEKFKEKNLELVIVGRGILQRELEQLASSLRLKGHVRFVGEVPHKDLYLWYSAGDLFCLASSREGWPNVVLESLACGTPVVASNIWGIPEILQSEEVGFLSNRNEQDMAEVLIRALSKPWRSESIIEFARAHTWDRVARDVDSVFEAVTLRGGT